jgi:ApbE superfamily uncharacterized protein (UPF0280 family)
MAAFPHIGMLSSLSSADFFFVMDNETVDADAEAFALCTTAAGTKASTATVEASTTQTRDENLMVKGCFLLLIILSRL